jgi:hypothetical protein
MKILLHFFVFALLIMVAGAALAQQFHAVARSD